LRFLYQKAARGVGHAQQETARIARNSGARRGGQEQCAARGGKSGARHGDSRTNAQHGAQKQARGMGAAKATRSNRRREAAARKEIPRCEAGGVYKAA